MYVFLKSLIGANTVVDVAIKLLIDRVANIDISFVFVVYPDKSGLFVFLIHLNFH